MIAIILGFFQDLFVTFPSKGWGLSFNSPLGKGKKVGLDFCLKMIPCLTEKAKGSGSLKLLVILISLSLSGPRCGLNNGTTQ